MTFVSTAPLKPENYGSWWNNNQADESWYKLIFETRPNAHLHFMTWFGERIRNRESLDTALEVGCGRAIPYGTYFKNIAYHGTDISQKEISYCRATYGGQSERFFVSDVIKEPPKNKYDLVFSHAVIDHVYDVNAFLTNLASATGKWLYISAYLNWYPNLDQHVYQWLEHVTCYHNAVSPAETRLVLSEAGLTDIDIYPTFSGRLDIGDPMETTIIARRP